MKRNHQGRAINIDWNYCFICQRKQKMNITNTDEALKTVESNITEAKKSSLVSGNQPGETFFITYPPAQVKCVGEYTFFVSKKHTQTKKFPLAKLFVRICFFPFKE